MKQFGTRKRWDGCSLRKGDCLRLIFIFFEAEILLVSCWNRRGKYENYAKNNERVTQSH